MGALWLGFIAMVLIPMLNRCGEAWLGFMFSTPFEIIYGEFSENIAGLPVGPAGDIVADSQKRRLNLLFAFHLLGTHGFVSRTLELALGAELDPVV